MSVNQSQTESHQGKIEILLFSLGGREVFGLNVFKIREVTETMPLTRMPGQHSAFMGIVSLRGNILPVVNLAAAVGMPADESPTKLIISEFASRTVAFAVSKVDKIVRVDWSLVRPPQSQEASQSCIFGVVMLDETHLVSLLDIESVCQRVIPAEDTPVKTHFEGLQQAAPVFFVDDSLVARRQITQVLDAMGLHHSHAINGSEAQGKLMAIAQGMGNEGGSIQDRVSLLLVDEEMPGMDGCTLTQTLRADPRFKHLPVIMYSSLTSDENERRGLKAGVNLYVKKFDAEKLSEAIGNLLTAPN